MFSKLGFIVSAAAAVKEGLSFVVVGDFTVIDDIQRPQAVFDAIAQMKSEAEPGSPEDFEFFITTGDNLYPLIDDKPTAEEFQ